MAKHSSVEIDVPEGKLIRLARAGDRTAFDRLATFLTAPLRGFLGRRVARQAVDDVMQETLLAAWTGMPRLEMRHAHTFDMWLYRIARNKAADWARIHTHRNAREIPITPSHENCFIEPDATSVIDQTAEMEFLLQRLSPDQATIVRLYYSEGLTLLEIARTENRNLSTVKYHFYRAQEILLSSYQSDSEATR